MDYPVCLVAMILLVGDFAFGQEQLGMRTSNYAGVNGLTLNPASSLTHPLSWDVNLAEAGQFFDNNYLYFENFRLLDARHLPAHVALRPELEAKGESTPENNLIIGFYHSQRRPDFSFHADILTEVMGPSAMVHINKNNVVGIYTRARGEFSGRKLPGVLGYRELADELYDTSFIVKAFKVDGMAWTELGLNYAHSFRTNEGKMSFGGTLKFLQGLEAGYGSMEQNMSFKQLPGNRLLGADGRTKHNFTIPAFDKNGDLRLYPKGYGVGLDLGMTFTIDKRKDLPFENENNYRQKIGVSLLDIGAVKFTKNAEAHQVIVTDSTSLYFDEYKQFSSLGQLDSIAKVFSRQTMKDPYASYRGDNFGMWLPMAVSLQADFAVSPGVYVNATLVQNIPWIKYTIRRSDVLGVTPRFESQWFEVALPMTLLNWSQLRSGFAMRLGFLWFGTEDLGSVVKRSDFNSTDVYVALKVNPLQMNFGKTAARQYQKHSTAKAKSKPRKGKTKCPKFGKWIGWRLSI